MAALQYVEVPGYAALILMRTFADLSLPKAGMARAHEWLGGTGAAWSAERKLWTFPSGATLSFGYLEKTGDEQRYRSAEFQAILFDELTRFREEQYRFLFSRLRRLATADVPLRMRAATNPGDRGHEWVKRRFVPDEYLKGLGAEKFGRPWWKAGRLFVPARLEDNEHLDREQYEGSLAELDPVTRAQLRHGDWKATFGGLLYKLEWFRRYRLTDGRDGYILPGRPGIVAHAHCTRFACCDPAGGISGGADYTACGIFDRTPQGDLCLVHVLHERIPFETIVRRLLHACRDWGAEYLILEGGMLQAALVRQARATGGMPPVYEVTPAGKSKLARALPSVVKAEAGGIFVPEEDSRWLDGFLDEIAQFTGDEDAHDDRVDMLAYAVLGVDLQGDDSEPFVAGERRTW